MKVIITLVVDDDTQADSVTAAFDDAVRAVRNLRNRTPFHDNETRGRLKVSADVLDAVGARYADGLAAARQLAETQDHLRSAIDGLSEAEKRWAWGDR